MTWLTVTGLVYGRTMFVGHFAVGFAAKRFAPKTSLGAQDRSAAAAIAAGVFSHWILDVVTHSPDMPITSLGAPEDRRVVGFALRRAARYCACHVVVKRT